MINLRSGGSVRLLVATLILLVPALAAARTLTVSSGDKSGIADALAGASFGDIVLVDCGIYFENALEIPDGVTLSGVGAEASCVQIVSPGFYSLVFFTDCGPLTRIENLTLTVDDGGIIPVARGGGINLMNASPVFSNVIFSGLEADYGGAVYCADGSAPVFQDCWFEDNYARAIGGAVACTGASMPEFERCLFVGNRAETSGGTINAALGSAPSLTECTVVRGDGAVGSGLASWDAAGLVLDRVIIVDGLTGRGWDGDAMSAPVPDCTDIFGNEGGDWVGALAPYEFTGGNLSADPQFCGAADSFNPYTLNIASPCGAVENPGCGGIGAFDVNCDFVSGVGQGSGGLPTVSRLHANFPNPFNPRTTIKFDLSRSGPVELAVFDVAGRLVKRLVSQSMSAGNHEAVWEGKDTGGRPASAGVYFFRLKTADTIDTKRMTLIK
jgi:hypothetical protein